VAHSGQIIDADFKVVFDPTADAVELDARTVERRASPPHPHQTIRAPAFTTMVIQQILQDRRAISIRQARRANAKRLRRWALAFGAAILFYVVSGGFGFDRIL
jgi:hypothetical protein